jgi:uncharacterized protein (DUF488 family)
MAEGGWRRGELRLPTDSLHVQSTNKAAWNDGRSPMHADFFTVGYMGRTVNELIDILKHAGVASVVDIRHNPVSMYRPEVSKANLQRSLEQQGFQYIHFRDLGVPREVRALAVGQEDRQLIWEWYDRNIVGRYAGKNLHWFFNALVHPVALLCVEFDPTSCHRHRLFQALEDQRLQGYDL